MLARLTASREVFLQQFSQFSGFIRLSSTVVRRSLLTVLLHRLFLLGKLSMTRCKTWFISYLRSASSFLQTFHVFIVFQDCDIFLTFSFAVAASPASPAASYNSDNYTTVMNEDGNNLDDPISLSFLWLLLNTGSNFMNKSTCLLYCFDWKSLW